MNYKRKRSTMTKNASHTQNTTYLDVLERVKELVARHPGAGQIRLMFKPAGLDLAADQVLVERESEGGLALEPKTVPSATERGQTGHVASPEQAEEVQVAKLIASRLWAATRAEQGPRPSSAGARPVHLPGLFDPTMLAELRVPIDDQRAASQLVALADQGIDMTRYRDPEAFEAAYAKKARTRVYESVNTRSDGPLSLVALLLSQAAGCHVVCTFYQSVAGDATMGEHDENWWGVIVQLRGAKRWFVRPDRSAAPQDLLLRAGDVLLLPHGTRHDVSTPDASLHAMFAILTYKPVLPHAAPDGIQPAQ